MKSGTARLEVIKSIRTVRQLNLRAGAVRMCYLLAHTFHQIECKSAHWLLGRQGHSSASELDVWGSHLAMLQLMRPGGRAGAFRYARV